MQYLIFFYGVSISQIHNINFNDQMTWVPSSLHMRFETATWGYVHTGPVPNGSDPILEWTISVHTVPFCSSTSVHMGPVCYGSVLNWSKKSSCFYQLSMRRIQVEAFKMTPISFPEPSLPLSSGRVTRALGTRLKWRQRSLIALLVPKGTGSRCLHLGPKRFQNWTCFFGGPVFGPDWRYCTVSRSRTKGLSVMILDRNHLEPVPCEHSLSCTKKVRQKLHRNHICKQVITMIICTKMLPILLDLL